VGDGSPAGCVRCGAASAPTYLPVETIAATVARSGRSDGVVLTGRNRSRTLSCRVW